MLLLLCRTNIVSRSHIGAIFCFAMEDNDTAGTVGKICWCNAFISFTFTLSRLHHHARHNSILRGPAIRLLSCELLAGSTLFESSPLLLISASTMIWPVLVFTPLRGKKSSAPLRWPLLLQFLDTMSPRRRQTDVLDTGHLAIHFAKNISSAMQLLILICVFSMANLYKLTRSMTVETSLKSQSASYASLTLSARTAQP